jgi:hypothetical protein
MPFERDTPMIVKAYRVVWRDRWKVLHASSPRFREEEEADRFARLLRNDPGVLETRVLPVVLRPILPPRAPR